MKTGEVAHRRGRLIKVQDKHNPKKNWIIKELSKNYEVTQMVDQNETGRTIASFTQVVSMTGVDSIALALGCVKFGDYYKVKVIKKMSAMGQEYV